MHDLRRNEKHLVVGSAHTDGIKLSQSGEWEYLLCQQHEAALGYADTYGVEFCRNARIAAAASCKHAFYEVANPRPELLSRFALSVVWRHVHSSLGRELGFTLGNHETVIRRAIFCGEPAPYQVGLNTTTLGLGGEPADIVSFPTRGKLANLNVWRFTVAQVEFTTLISSQRLPRRFDAVLGSSADPATVMRMPLEEVGGSVHRTILERMRRKKARPLIGA
jgi:hypothetical protein